MPDVTVPVYIGYDHKKLVGVADVNEDGSVFMRIDPIEGAQFIEHVTKNVLRGLSVGFDYSMEPPAIPAEQPCDHDFTD